MLAKKTSQNQVTLPPKALQDIPEIDYFDITAQGGVLILRPATVGDPGSRLAVVRQNSTAPGIVPKDWDRAIAWAEDTEAAADPSRSRHERHHVRAPVFRPTVAIRLSLAIQPPSANHLCP